MRAARIASLRARARIASHRTAATLAAAAAAAAAITACASAQRGGRDAAEVPVPAIKSACGSDEQAAIDGAAPGFAACGRHARYVAVAVRGHRVLGVNDFGDSAGDVPSGLRNLLLVDGALAWDSDRGAPAFGRDEPALVLAQRLGPLATLRDADAAAVLAVYLALHLGTLDGPCALSPRDASALVREAPGLAAPLRADPPGLRRERGARVLVAACVARGPAAAGVTGPRVERIRAALSAAGALSSE